MTIVVPDANRRAAPPRRPADWRCEVEGCGGEVLRRSLGNGMAIGRCSRCFARYEIRPASDATEKPGRLRDFLHELVTWREED